MVASGSGKPEWIPENPEGGTYASEVKPGVTGGLPGMTLRKSKGVRRKPIPQATEAVTGVLAGDRTLLARAITLIESRAPAHQEPARAILRACLPHAGKSIRIGITGVPGAGKSTFIEAFGSMLCASGHKVAVLAVDPSSSVHGGSVLGDKTRMEELSRHPNAFIRPSPSGGTLGGVAQRVSVSCWSRPSASGKVRWPCARWSIFSCSCKSPERETNCKGSKKASLKWPTRLS